MSSNTLLPQSIAMTLPNPHSVISRQFAVVAPNVSLGEAIAPMTADATISSLDGGERSSSVDCVWVVAGQNILGVLAAADVVRSCADPIAWQQLRVQRVIAQPSAILPESALTSELLTTYLLRADAWAPIAIVDAQQRLVGMVTRESLWSGLAQAQSSQLDTVPESTDRQSSTCELPTEQSDVSTALIVPTPDGGVENIFDMILAGYWDWDIPNDREYMSPGFKRMFGYADHELPNVPETWQNLIFAEDLPQVMATFEQHVASRGRTPFDSEVRYRHKDGSTVWVRCTGRVIAWDDQGQPQRVVGCHIDITQRKQAELNTQAAKAELENFFLVTLDLLCIADTQGRFRRVNRAWEKTLGYQIDDLEGRSFLDFVHPDDVEATIAAIAKLQEQDVVEAFINRYRCKDGSYRYIEWYSRPRGDLIYAAARDITHRRQLELRLRKQAAHLKTAQRIAGMGSWEYDLRTGEIVWSDEVFQIFDRDPTLGTPNYEELLQLYVPEDQAYHDRVVQAAIAHQQSYDLDLRVRHPDGSLIYVQARGEPILNDDGELVQLVGTILDITERKTAEAKILQTSAQLAASNDELEAFAYSVSHDLRAPLRAIEGFSQALLEDYGDQFDDLGQNYFARIRNNVQRMNDLINDLLALSRVSRSEMTYQQVNLSELVARQVADLRTLAPDRQVDLVIQPDVTAWGDATLLGVVISNLVQNAWKFTQHHAQARIEFGQCQQRGKQVYFLRDDGAGFDMAHVDMLFGVFQRLHDMTEFPGTGIGLATVKRVIHRHGGEVWAEGAIEQGATLYFSLPHPLEQPRQSTENHAVIP